MRKISLLRPTVLCLLGALAFLPGCRDRNGAGPELQVLTTDDHNDQFLAYSPDGSRTAWWQQSDAGWDLMVGDADLGSAGKRASAKVSAGPLFWSPDGGMILFGSDTISFLDLWTVPADSGPAIRRTSLAGLEFPSSWVGEDFQYFSSRAGGELFAWQYSMADRGPVRMVPSESSPHWAVPSPDGSRVAWNRFEGGQRTIWVTDSAGTPKQLTTEGFEHMAEQPWSPDGSEILYTSRRTGTDDIWAAPVNGDTPRQLTRDVRNDREPVWSPDGRSVAFISDRGKQTDVWVVPSAGGEPAALPTPRRRRPIPSGDQAPPNSRSKKRWNRPGSGASPSGTARSSGSPPTRSAPAGSTSLPMTRRSCTWRSTGVETTTSG